MKFVVDNQLPGALSTFIKNAGHDCIHVLDHGMEESSDSEIWDFAKARQMVVVSKDEDFFHLSNRVGDEGRLLWVRIGNCRKGFLIQRFQTSFESVIRSFEMGVRVVEIR